MKSAINQRRYAQITGFSLIIMTIVAGLVMGLIFQPLFESNVEAISNDLELISSQIGMGIIGWIIILILDLIVSYTLFKYFIAESKSLIMGALRFVYSIILLFAILQLIMLQMSESNAAEIFETLQFFQSIWQFGLIIFGVHLIVLSRLVCVKKDIRQVIAVLLFVAGMGYFLSNTADLFISNYEQIRSNVELIFILPMIFGEFGLAIWMTIKGGKVKDSTKIKKQFAS